MARCRLAGGGFRDSGGVRGAYRRGVVVDGALGPAAVEHAFHGLVRPARNRDAGIRSAGDRQRRDRPQRTDHASRRRHGDAEPGAAQPHRTARRAAGRQVRLTAGAGTGPSRRIVQLWVTAMSVSLAALYLWLRYFVLA